MNLNECFPLARYASGAEVSGERAYSRYSSRILPYLLSVGGSPDVIGPVVTTDVVDESDSLHDDWSGFALVCYPA
jgi:hypothetical protein